MNLSFYVATTGVKGQQSSMDTIANNMANISNNGYKTTNASFVDLLYQNMYDGAEPTLSQGVGGRVEKTNTIYKQGFFVQTNSLHDFAIEGEGFFAVENSVTGEIEYTRDGAFSRASTDDGFMLVTSSGYNVLDKNGEPINLTGNEYNLGNKIGVYEFATKEGLLKQGNNTYVPTPKNGVPILAEENNLKSGMLEASNVEMTTQMAKIIESQRAYQFNIKMIQTTDEIMQTVNALR